MKNKKTRCICGHYKTSHVKLNVTVSPQIYGRCLMNCYCKEFKLPLCKECGGTGLHTDGTYDCYYCEGTGNAKN